MAEEPLSKVQCIAGVKYYVQVCAGLARSTRGQIALKCPLASKFGWKNP